MARIYPDEFRRDAVALVRSSEKTVAQVAKELGLNRETLRLWAKQERIRASAKCRRVGFTGL